MSCKRERAKSLIRLFSCHFLPWCKK